MALKKPFVINITIKLHENIFFSLPCALCQFNSHTHRHAPLENSTTASVGSYDAMRICTPSKMKLKCRNDTSKFSGRCFCCCCCEDKESRADFLLAISPASSTAKSHDMATTAVISAPMSRCMLRGRPDGPMHVKNSMVSKIR